MLCCSQSFQNIFIIQYWSNCVWMLPLWALAALWVTTNGSTSSVTHVQPLFTQASRQKRSFQRSSIVDVGLFQAALWLTPTHQHVPFHPVTMNMQDLYYLLSGIVHEPDSFPSLLYVFLCLFCKKEICQYSFSHTQTHFCIGKPGFFSHQDHEVWCWSMIIPKDCLLLWIHFPWNFHLEKNVD